MALRSAMHDDHRGRASRKTDCCAARTSATADDVRRSTSVASGWGYTDDYHDWAVGLLRGDNGEYFIGLPCQQDQAQRGGGQAIAGNVLKLVPREHDAQTTRDCSTSKSSPPATASRWAWPGIATGELFVTDNQGNYNPFNELNHVRPGAHFGFINALEKEQGFKPPPLDEPAINIPHPWTRSVNGICFLDTPTQGGLAPTRAPGARSTSPSSARSKAT